MYLNKSKKSPMMYEVRKGKSGFKNTCNLWHIQNDINSLSAEVTNQMSEENTSIVERKVD